MILRNRNVTAEKALQLPDSCDKVSRILSRIGHKWIVFVVLLLGDGPLRFSALKRKIGSVAARAHPNSSRFGARRLGYSHGVFDRYAAR